MTASPFQVLVGSSELATTRFAFPDGQPHISVRSNFDSVVGRVNVSARIRNPAELIETLLLHDALRANGAAEVHLTILYLMGARMDRAMPSGIAGHHPFTLAVVADVVRSVKWDSVSIFDPHSDVATALLRARAIPATDQILAAMAAIGTDVLIVSPDAGAAKRLEAITKDLGTPDLTSAMKHRDMATGKLSGFRLLEPEVYQDRDCLIVDDLCDGGFTFTSIGERMVDAGARSVSLYVSHGVFSKGFDLANIGRIFTTDSYCQVEDPPAHVTIYSL